MSINQFRKIHDAGPQPERRVVGAHILTPPKTFYKKEVIDGLQQDYKKKLDRALRNVQKNSLQDRIIRQRHQDELAGATRMYKIFRKNGHRNETYSTTAGIKIYTTSSGVLYVTDGKIFEDAHLTRDDFTEVEHNTWALELARGSFAQGGLRGNYGEEMTVNHTSKEKKWGVKTTGRFTIPLMDLYRIEGTADESPDLWQNPNYTWDFRPKPKK